MHERDYICWFIPNTRGKRVAEPDRYVDILVKIKSDLCLKVFHVFFCCNRKCLSVFTKMKKIMRVNVNSINQTKIFGGHTKFSSMASVNQDPLYWHQWTCRSVMTSILKLI